MSDGVWITSIPQAINVIFCRLLRFIQPGWDWSFLWCRPQLIILLWVYVEISLNLFGWSDIGCIPEHWFIKYDIPTYTHFSGKGVQACTTLLLEWVSHKDSLLRFWIKLLSLFIGNVLRVQLCRISVDGIGPAFFYSASCGGLHHCPLDVVRWFIRYMVVFATSA